MGSDETRDEHGGNEEELFVVSYRPGDRQNGAPERNPRDERDPYAKCTFWIGTVAGTAIQVLLLLAAVFAGVAVMGQLDAMHDSNEELRKATRAAETSAAAAAKQVEASLRSWIVVKGIKFTGFRTDEETIVYMTIENIGHGPASLHRIWREAQLLEGAIPFDGPRYKEKDVMLGTLGPNHERDVPIVVHDITDADTQALAAGTKKLYVWLRVTYSDITRSVRTCTTCLEWNTVDAGFGNCDRFNDCP